MNGGETRSVTVNRPSPDLSRWFSWFYPFQEIFQGRGNQGFPQMGGWKGRLAQTLDALGNDRPSIPEKDIHFSFKDREPGGDFVICSYCFHFGAGKIVLSDLALDRYALSPPLLKSTGEYH
ncbi:hypothetical protein ACLOJK_020090 [Asimina triloba]